MKETSSLLRLLLATFLFPALVLHAQSYIGFVYPAGGQQGTTFSCTLGGQSLEGVCGVSVSGPGVQGRVLEYNKKMNPQEMQLLGEQMRELKALPAPKRDASVSNLITRLEKFIGEYVQQPQCDSIANLVVAEITIAKNAPPGPREIRLYTPKGLSNPMAFHVGQLPEVSGDPLSTSPKQILGKEAQSLRKRKRAQEKGKDAMMGMEMMQMAMGMAGPGAQSDVDDDEVCITPPCTVNGQIASGSVDRYRFTARRGQRLVFTVQARTLVPYMADAVPGWFQPVLVLCNAQGKEVAYNDDYRFKPDPVLFCEIPMDGEYILAIHDSIFRGREDFVYRITLGELPFVTCAFPLGGQAGMAAAVDVKGVNLAESHLMPQTKDRAPGIYPLTVRGKGGLLSNPIPFAIDALPDGLESEPNNTAKNAQRVSPPLVVNGTIGTPGDRDLFQFEGRAGQELVAEIFARRLDSPLDATLKLTDPKGACLALNDDQEDVGSGVNTHHADSYLSVKLPADGTYTLTLGDAQHKGGEAYAYRLRISAPQPDFDLRVVPSRIVMRGKDAAGVTVHAIRKDGFTGAIRFQVKDPASGFTVLGAPITGTQTVARITVKTSLPETDGTVPLVIQGVATNAGVPLVRDAVAAEDRMQAFLWRHLVPAQELRARVYPVESKK
ncbi:MAG TPA: PPC domain-containing protein [Kiritimatiellia bacterium]|nr:PPC domain-containing protein [Kiritimatiellia bacterium]HPS06407.1 PPC domain-containing protein [Kiritimatiellia bacterium]